MTGKAEAIAKQRWREVMRCDDCKAGKHPEPPGHDLCQCGDPGCPCGLKHLRRDQ